LDFKRRNEKGDIPLMIAIFRRLPNAISSLIHFSDVNSYDFHKNTPFIAAASNGDITTLQLLINSKHCNSLARNYDGQSALHRACFFGEMETV
jgi:ankyrin repeat protein